MDAGKGAGESVGAGASTARALAQHKTPTTDRSSVASNGLVRTC